MSRIAAWVFRTPRKRFARLRSVCEVFLRKISFDELLSKMKIYLIGFMGCGKTTVGQLLAQQTGFDFVDTDQLIEMRQGMTVSEIFAKHGEAAFRLMECNILEEVQRLKNAAVSTGGGMPCHNNCMEIMLSTGKVVYLKTSPQELSRRLLQPHTARPLVRGKTEAELQQYIETELARRESFYNRAHAVLQTENFSMNELLQRMKLLG
jgi:shikimate kinase